MLEIYQASTNHYLLNFLVSSEVALRRVYTHTYLHPIIAWESSPIMLGNQQLPQHIETRAMISIGSVHQMLTPHSHIENPVGTSTWRFFKRQIRLNNIVGVLHDGTKNLLGDWLTSRRFPGCPIDCLGHTSGVESWTVVPV